ncbi:MAG: hypothetical protein FJ280_15430 [Planctomycetes bacterium]|nr:hypothetical protein [Planctomycetota bacterium]
MKREYDFAKGERGKFYSPEGKHNLPVYLDSDVRRFVEDVAKKKRCDVSTVVNRMLKSDMRRTTG